MSRIVEKYPSPSLIGTIVIVAIAGSIALSMSRAATPFVSLEPEAGTRTGTAALVADTTASGGSAVKFGATTPPPTTSGVYGPGFGLDTKANIVINSAESLAMKFKAGTTSTLAGVRWMPRMGGTGYSLGSGGTTTLSIQADNGAGKPSGTKLATTTWADGNNPAGEERPSTAIFSPVLTLTAGTIYYIVFENPSASNYISANLAYCYDNHTGPRQPHFNDADFGVLLTTSYGGAWSNTVANAQGYTPVVDVIYANGHHDGNAYNEAMIGYWGTISGASSMVRESFTVSGGSRSVSQAGVRVRRGGGTANLVLTLETAAGTAVASGTVPASSVPISSPGGDNGGSVWVVANFGSSVTLTNGVAYNLRLSTAAGTTYTTHPIRNASENFNAFGSYDFKDGIPYLTTNGSTWTKMAVSPYTAENFDLQFYLN